MIGAAAHTSEGRKRASYGWAFKYAHKTQSGGSMIAGELERCIANMRYVSDKAGIDRRCARLEQNDSLWS